VGKTTITHPDGSKTVVQSSGGCGSGCTWVFAICLLVSACAAMPILIPITVAVLAAMVFAVYRRRERTNR
jgi:hypothetical protein